MKTSIDDELSDLEIDLLMERAKDAKWWRALIMVAVGAVLAFVIYADVHAATVPQFTVSLYKGTSKASCASYPGQCSGATEIDAWTACQSAASALQKTTTSPVTCKTPVMSLATVPDPPPMTATLSWPLVTQNANDSPYVDPFGYVINYGNAPDQLTQSIDVNDPNAAKYVVQGLTAGQWFFCVRSRNTSNVRSDCSNVVSKTL